MSGLQKLFIISFGLSNLVIFLMGIYRSIIKRDLLARTIALGPIGIFVWADATVIGLFWMMSSLVSLLFKDWILFLLVFSVFWVVRSLGETIYFFNQQFSKITRAPGKTMMGYGLFKDEYVIWFIYQLYMQCITVVSIITSVYLFNLWLKG